MFGPTTFGVNAGRYLQLCAQSEGGTLYVRKDGVLRFEERSSAPGANALTFSDDGDAANVAYLTVDQNMSNATNEGWFTRDVWKYKARTWYGIGLYDDRYWYFSEATTAPDWT